MKTVSCPSCGEDIEPNREPAQIHQCAGCGCGAWVRIVLETPELPLVTHWAEDVFDDERAAIRRWPDPPWGSV